MNALANGRQEAAVALREVLREQYAAALRAYPDPADPVALAVSGALPEPSALTAHTGRGRDTLESVAAQLAESGVGEQAAINEAVTALRVAVAETPRRTGLGRAFNATVAETVRQAVAAVQACDTASSALVAALAERTGVANARPAAAEGPCPVGPAPARGNGLRSTTTKPLAPAATAPARSTANGGAP